MNRWYSKHGFLLDSYAKKYIFSVINFRLFTLFILATWVSQPGTILHAQSLPEVPNELDFAGVSIHLTQQGRLQIQQEVQHLYTRPSTIQADINALRQLTPLLKPMLKKANLADDFRFLTLPFADIDTLGCWNLSQPQARSLNLRVDSAIDERYHLIISTDTVLNYLNRLQQTQRNYGLTLIHYLQSTMNAGALGQIDPAYILPGPQTSPLLWKILARKLVIEHEEPTYRPTVSYVLYTYPNGAGQTLQAIAERLQIAEDRVKSFNQWLKTAVIPNDKEYPVLVQLTPDEFSTVQSFAESRTGNGNRRPIDIGFPVLVKLKIQADGLKAGAIYYDINERRGIQAQNCDNFITLAFYGDITINAFLEFNDLSEKHDAVQPGKIYYLQRKAKRAKIPFHIVRNSQTLPEIAHMYGVRLESLLKLNRMIAIQRIQPGRILWLQTKRPNHQPVQYIELPAEEQKIDFTNDSTIANTVERSQELSNEKFTRQQISVDSLVMVIDSLQANVTKISDDKLTQWDTRLDKAPEKLKLHVVMPGQTYYAISRLYGVTLKQLYAWNNLSERIPLKIGQELIIDTYEKRPLVLVKPKHTRKVQSEKLINLFSVTHSAKDVIHYIVRAGQTLYRIALINKVMVKDLMSWNNLTNYTIEVGQTLLIRK